MVLQQTINDLGKSMAIIRIGVDLAKNVFAVHGVDETGRVALTRTVRREQLLEVRAAVPSCIVAMEACSGAHHWARQLVALGHTTRILAPKFVAPYRMSGKQEKSDANDAAAICVAAGRPNMRFVPMKTAAQQALLTVYRVRQGLVEERTATINRLRRGAHVVNPKPATLGSTSRPSGMSAAGPIEAAALRRAWGQSNSRRIAALCGLLVLVSAELRLRPELDHAQFALDQIKQALQSCPELQSGAEREVDPLRASLGVAPIGEGQYAVEAHACRAAPNHDIAVLKGHAQGAVGPLQSAEQKNG